MGMAALSSLWQRQDDQEWQLQASSFDVVGTYVSTSAASPLQRVRPELCGDICGVSGKRLVWARCTSLRGGSVDACLPQAGSWRELLARGRWVQMVCGPGCKGGANE